MIIVYLISFIFAIYSLLVSFPLYAICLTIMFRNRHKYPYNSSFFLIFFITGVVDLLCYLGSIYRELPNYGITPPHAYPLLSDNAIHKTFMIVYKPITYVQHFLMATVALNRFTTMCLPESYQKYWTPKYIYRLIFVFFIIAYASVIPFFFTAVYYTMKTGVNPNAVPQFLEKKIDGPRSAIDAIYRWLHRGIIAFVLVSCIAMHARIGVLLWQRRQHHKQQQQQHPTAHDQHNLDNDTANASLSSSIERRFCYYAIVTFVIYLALIYILFFGEFDSYQFANAIFYLNAPYCLLIVSPTMRNNVVRVVTCGRYGTHVGGESPSVKVVVMPGGNNTAMRNVMSQNFIGNGVDNLVKIG